MLYYVALRHNHRLFIYAILPYPRYQQPRLFPALSCRGQGPIHPAYSADPVNVGLPTLYLVAMFGVSLYFLPRIHHPACSDCQARLTAAQRDAEYRHRAELEEQIAACKKIRDDKGY